jgi:iron complex outermembrane receptor protein
MGAGRRKSDSFTSGRMQFRHLISGLATGCTLMVAAPALAQQAAPAPEPANSGFSAGDIVVTARKRSEIQLDVPVIETVISSQTLARQQTLDLKDLTKLTPGLMIGTAVLSIGQQVTLRGVGTSSFDPGIDQSVSLNIDGMPLGQGLAFGSGMFDVGQVEVLKGPQSLLYGKGSPGGVIAIHTADPTDRFEVKGSAAYEGEAHTKRFEGVVSGPITDTLKARIAGFFQNSDGYYYNGSQVPADATFSPAPGVTLPVSTLGGVTPRYDRLGRTQNYQVRGTVLWNPGDRFSAKLKVTYVHDRAFNGENGQLKYCPDGLGGVPAFGNAPFLNPTENCKFDRTGSIVDMNPASYPGLSSGTDAVTSQIHTRQIYSTLEMNYDLTDELTATSVTGYYDLKSHSIFNPSFAAYSGPLIAVTNPAFHRHDLTQEVRVNSNLAGPFNFTLGGFYQDGNVSNQVSIFGNRFFVKPTPGLPLQDGLNRFSITTYSAFGQARYNIIPQIEVDAGVRVTSEKRHQTPFLFGSQTVAGGIASGQLPASALNGFAPPTTTPTVNSVRASPEFTVSWKPTDNFNVFGSYKIAFKSGSFSIATPASLISTPGQPLAYLDNAFGDEKAEGYEAGIKGRMFDRQLNFSLAAYNYKYTGLQVGGIEPTVGNIPVVRTVNAGAGRSKGIEFEAHLTPRDAIPGLTLNGAVNYTKARFIVLDNIPCTGGQTIAEGCNLQFVPSPDQTVPAAGAVTVNGVKGLYFAQDLSGTPFLRAPDWAGNFGFDYEIPLPNDWKLIASNNNYYTSKFLTTPGLGSQFYQKGYIKFDASLTLQGKDNRWEIALIGKNLTRQYTASSCSPSNSQNGLLGGEITGGNTAGPAGHDEVVCYMDPGRELWIRLTLRPFG